MKMLLLFIGESEKFDAKKVESIFAQIPNMENFKKDNLIGVIIECEFAYHNDFTLIRLTEDLETITLSGDGDASLKAALEIQKYYDKSLRLIDSNYSFDLVLEKIISVDELRQKILESSLLHSPLISS